ncbi:MAG TPA: glycosyltransferase [Blastocatellia bacterium]|nr:glycosyltransferase [Blastocatellia bacterium]
MSAKPAVLFYCQHSLGMGHLVRSMALAAGLTEQFRVVFLNGGPLPEGVNLPSGIEVTDLPPLGIDPDGRLVSRDPTRTVGEARKIRRRIILETFHSLRPQIVLIELFPFGRKKFADELLPLLDEASNGGPFRPLIICSLRDILVGQRSDQKKYDERVVAIADRYFDAILVHSDPSFARLEQSFQACSKLTTPIHYTGYVAPGRNKVNKSCAARQGRIVVSAGGGLVGYPLLKEAIAAHALLQEDDLEMRVIAGPFIPEESWQSLRSAAQGRQGLQLLKTVPNLCEEMRAAAASISQCGYNTSLDILQSRVAGLVVPFAEGSEDEQMKRARLLEQVGAVRVLDQRQMNARRLADEIRALLSFRPKASAIDLNGVRKSARLLEELLQARQSGRTRPQGAATASASSWLDPVRRALDEAPEPVSFFFRDDDAGWEDDRLFRLLDMFADFDLPVDLAVIPQALTPRLAREISRRIEAGGGRIGVHQHGFAHNNYEVEGRKCEFGPARTRAQQERDIESGKSRLAELCGPVVQPIFTPPWNRCTTVTGECLVRLGFRVLSRDNSAGALGVSGLLELPVTVDWFAKRKGLRLKLNDMGALVAAAIKDSRPIGIMFHHAIMDAEERRAAGELLGTLAAHDGARCDLMQSLSGGMSERYSGVF